MLENSFPGSLPVLGIDANENPFFLIEIDQFRRLLLVNIQPVVEGILIIVNTLIEIPAATHITHPIRLWLLGVYIVNSST